MAKQVLFVQGAGEGAHKEDARLAESLRSVLGPSYEVRYPEIPNDGDTDYESWKRVILTEIADMGKGAILVGHSIGASVLIKILIDSRPNLSIAGMFLVAGPFWHRHEVWQWDEAALPTDASDRIPADLPIFLYHGEADETVPLSHVEMHAKALPRAVVRRLEGRDHQLNDDLTDVARDIKNLHS
jgi:predicted alpha/beta hydrolase family esterase